MKTKIPFIDLRSQYLDLKNEIKNRIDRVGSEVEKETIKGIIAINI